MWLFSYGSNSPAQLAERLGHEVEGQAAFAPGHKRVFRGVSRRWGGGTASLQRSAERPAYGWIAEVMEEDLDILDRYEGVPRVYKRAKVKVLTVDGEELQAIAYVHTSGVFGEPTQEYLEAVARTISAFWRQGGRKIRARDIVVE